MVAPDPTAEPAPFVKPPAKEPHLRPKTKKKAAPEPAPGQPLSKDRKTDSEMTPTPGTVSKAASLGGPPKADKKDPKKDTAKQDPKQPKKETDRKPAGKDKRDPDNKPANKDKKADGKDKKAQDKKVHHGKVTKSDGRNKDEHKASSSSKQQHRKDEEEQARQVLMHQLDGQIKKVLDEMEKHRAKSM